MLSGDGHGVGRRHKRRFEQPQLGHWGLRSVAPQHKAAAAADGHCLVNRSAVLILCRKADRHEALLEGRKLSGHALDGALVVVIVFLLAFFSLLPFLKLLEFLLSEALPFVVEIFLVIEVIIIVAVAHHLPHIPTAVRRRGSSSASFAHRVSLLVERVLQRLRRQLILVAGEEAVAHRRLPHLWANSVPPARAHNKPPVATRSGGGKCGNSRRKVCRGGGRGARKRAASSSLGRVHRFIIVVSAVVEFLDGSLLRGNRGELLRRLNLGEAAADGDANVGKHSRGEEGGVLLRLCSFACVVRASSGGISGGAALLRLLLLEEDGGVLGIRVLLGRRDNRNGDEPRRRRWR